MKRFIKWLAFISGVGNDIQREARKEIGENLIQDSYWWNGGLMYSSPINSVANFSVLYGEKLKEGFYRPDISKIRDDVYKMEKQNLYVHKDREIYGYWSDKTYPHFISIKDYRLEEGYKPKLRIVWK